MTNVTNTPIHANLILLSGSEKVEDIENLVNGQRFIIVAHWTGCYYCTLFLDNGGFNSLLEKMHTECPKVKFFQIELATISKMQKENKEVYKFLKLSTISYYPYIYTLDANAINFLEIFQESVNNNPEALEKWVKETTVCVKNAKVKISGGSRQTSKTHSSHKRNLRRGKKNKTKRNYKLFI